MNKFRVEKEFEVDEFKCVIIGQNWGHRCGYIEIPLDHKYYGVDYDDVNIDIHGGWTYSGYTHNDYPIKSSNGTWWLGFDCANYCDAKDIELVKSFGNTETTRFVLAMNDYSQDHGTVRTLEYVENELRNAVKELKEIR